MPPLPVQGLPELDVYSNVHSNTFPAKSYIFNILFLSVAPVVNNLLLELGFVYVHVIGLNVAPSSSEYFAFVFVTSNGTS